MQLYLSISCCHRRARRETATEDLTAEDWDVISLPSETEPEADLNNRQEEEVETRRPTAAEESQTDFRWYCVWGFSTRDPNQVGVHCGLRRSAYDGLLRLNGGGLGGLKFKRLASYQAARKFYITKTEWNYKEIIAGTAPEPTINCYTWKCRQ